MTIFEKKFIESVKVQDFDLLKSLVEDHMLDVNIVDEDGNSALFYATGLGCIDIIQFLFEKESNVNCKNNDGVTPLMVASLSDYVFIAKLLIEKGADVNASDIEGNTPLIYACLENSEGIVEYLISANANINKQNNCGNTPLICAVEQGYVSIIQKLIEEGADIEIENNEGHTALGTACVLGYGAVLNIFLEKVKIKINSNAAGNILCSAAIHGLNSVANELIEKGVNVNYEIDSFIRPLLLAVKNGCIDMVKLLLKNRAEIAMETVDGILLKPSAEPLQDSLNALLVISVENSHIDLVKFFLEAGAEVDVLIKELNITPLILACKDGKFEIFKILVSAGADLDARAGNETIFSIAIRNNYPEIIKYLLKIGMKVNDELILAVQCNNFTVLQLLIEACTNINIQDKNGYTALMYASAMENIEMIDLLLKNGADIHIKGNDGFTAHNMHNEEVNKYIIMQSGQIGIIIKNMGENLNAYSDDGNTLLIQTVAQGDFKTSKSLIAAGANVNISSLYDSVTPLMAAAMIGNMDIIELLLEHGAEINARNKDGTTALSVASYYKHPLIALYLKTQGATT